MAHPAHGVCVRWENQNDGKRVIREPAAVGRALKKHRFHWQVQETQGQANEAVGESFQLSRLL